ncbi:MAG TPA: NADH-quinone oxidoreductase subunit C [Acidimicrobiales bacterium]|nr:NADH-quinone oxidoreductase subunit C [Acidimicrobiales bacterium]
MELSEDQESTMRSSQKSYGHNSARESDLVPIDELVLRATGLFAKHYRLAMIAAHDDGDALRVVYVFLAGPPDHRVELQVRLDQEHPSVPSLSHLSFSASRFERENRDLFGIEPLGHPFLRRLVLHQHWPEDFHPMLNDAGEVPPMLVDAPPFPFVEVGGREVYEIPVGPVHAGVIEPGHFRFSVVGETIIKMKARLWFVHRGIERLFEGREVDSGVEIAERISGDSAVGHNLAYSLAIEEACRITVPEEGLVLRAILLELERVYNHVSNIGDLCNDVGFGIAQSRALVLRERLLRLNAEITGHRLLRGAIRPGSTELLRLPGPMELDSIENDFEDLIELATSSSVVMERFRGTAVLSLEDVAGIGVIGLVARASGLADDARLTHPFLRFDEPFEPVVEEGGDVLARFLLRVREVRTSLLLIRDLLERAPDLRVTSAIGSVRGGSGLGIVEGWRGGIVHRVEIDARGSITRCKVVDPSFLNWPALSVALKDTIVPDFPLVNKSFNLSYAGNDL